MNSLNKSATEIVTDFLFLPFFQTPLILNSRLWEFGVVCGYGHENEMYKESVNLKRGKDVCMRELRECGGRTENKTKCAKG